MKLSRFFLANLPVMLSALLVMPVSAHTPFLAPISFTPAHESWVSLDAGFAEVFFQPDVAFDKGDFQLLTPAGVWQKPGRLEAFKTRTLIEHQLTEKGTYRFSTGLRYGAVFRFYELNGERKAIRDPKEALPAGAKLVDHYQSVTLAETYITNDKPTAVALKPYSKGLEVVPVTHPSDVYAGEKFAVKVLLDGKPLANKEISVFKAQDGSEHEKPYLNATTNTKGEAELAMADTGIYLLHTRHTAPAPKNAEAPNYGYVYTLSFQVEPAL
ncbi:MAG: hypothetical protein B0W54_08490 [Cellvibrio sp. 79]|nr:MAG: hypothetical protein B0W54_08490 [Cellvibrio sp. 79]